MFLLSQLAGWKIKRIRPAVYFFDSDRRDLDRRQNACHLEVLETAADGIRVRIRLPQSYAFEFDSACCRRSRETSVFSRHLKSHDFSDKAPEIDVRRNIGEVFRDHLCGQVPGRFEGTIGNLT